MELESVRPSDLRPHPRNYRDHPDDQLVHIKESLREHGVYRNVVIARDGTILAGHGVVKASVQMELEQIPVYRLDLDPNDPRALKILAGDNSIEHLAIQDDRVLTELLKEIKETDPDGLLGTGYDEMMLANLLMVTRPRNEILDFNEAAEWVGMPEYDAGTDVIKVVVSFESEEARSDFAAKLEISPALAQKNMWWPPRQNDDLMSVRFVG